ncbi:Hypothetical protein NocV09_01500390 [Nannochloropsis oceanica]
MTKHGTFDPAKSQVSHEAQLLWLRSPITGDLTEVPGIGPKHAEHLHAKDIHTTHQLIGEYLKMKGKDVDPKMHAQHFYDHIQAYGVSSHRTDVVDAIASKVSMWLPGMYDASAFHHTAGPTTEGKNEHELIAVAATDTTAATAAAAAAVAVAAVAAVAAAAVPFSEEEGGKKGGGGGDSCGNGA